MLKIGIQTYRRNVRNSENKTIKIPEFVGIGFDLEYSIIVEESHKMLENFRLIPIG